VVRTDNVIFPPGSDPVRALGSVPFAAWSGETWRNHARRYHPTDPGGSRVISGRYHRAPDLYPHDPCWSALYLSLTDGGALAELTRRIEPTTLPRLNDRRLSRIRVALSNVLDLRDPSIIGVSITDLTDDYDYSLTQALAETAVQRGAEALLVPAASLVTSNLVVFVENLVPTSVIEAIDSIDPRLYVPRS
jgi:hypothetical protein